MTNLILSALASRKDQDWIGGVNSKVNSKKIAAIATRVFQELAQELADLSPGSTLPKILLCELETWQFLGQFMAAVAAGCPIFLGNPHWSKQEWQQVFSLVQPDIIWGKSLDHYIWENYLETYPEQTRRKTFSFVPSDTIQSGIMIPTGGSSGKIRFAIHTWDTLTASIRGFREYFQISTVNSFCLLPLYHVSGLMQFLRSFTSGGTFVSLPSYKDILDRNILEAIASDPGSKSKKHTSELGKIDPATFFISLVPTQLSRLLQNPTAANWLSQFKTVLLGGAPPWPELLDMARQQQINLAPTYGMTETASQVVTLKPEDFLAGNNSCGRVLPHANIEICGENSRQLDINQIGIIKIRAKSLALGYYPPVTGVQFSNKPPDFISDDLGFFDVDGFLNIVGRRSDKIITGGENVFPAEVEAAIRYTGLVKDVCAIALKDPDWGQAIAAIYVANGSGVSADSLTQGLVNRLAKFKHPKYWVPVAQLPRNSQGKINRDLLHQIAESWRLISRDNN